jgi:hypothetical protein
VVKLAIRQDMACLFPNGMVILLRPAFLESYNVWLRIGGGDLDSNFGKTFIAELGDELEPPAVEGQDTYARRRCGGL